MLGQFCIVRTYSAGVHMGVVVECNGTAVMLKNARRLWLWTGANTLNEASQNGVAKDSRISKPVPVILLTQAVEVIPCSDKARKNLEESRWSN